MGSGHNKIRKLFKSECEYNDSHSLKHTHNFSIKCILEVSNNKNNMINYYNVVKCSECNSFKSIKKEGNIQGHIFNTNEIDKRLPRIKAISNSKYIIIEFSKLKKVEYYNIKE